MTMTTQRIERIHPGEVLPETVHRCDTVQLFLYNAALWNAHRIHFDHPYATGAEGYPGLVIAGPLIGDWLAQCAMDWLSDDGRLVSLDYSNRRASYAGDVLTAGGIVRTVDPVSGRVELELFVRAQNGDIVAPGSAVVELRVA
jgi:3-methylfumaryl-CoA hydratase